MSKYSFYHLCLRYPALSLYLNKCVENNTTARFLDFLMELETDHELGWE